MRCDVGASDSEHRSAHFACLLVYWAAPATSLHQRLLAVPLAPRAPRQPLQFGVILSQDQVSLNNPPGARCFLPWRWPLRSARRRRVRKRAHGACRAAPRTGHGLVGPRVILAAYPHRF